MPKCSTCQKEVVHVRDDFTGSSFPVDAAPVRVRGYALHPPAEGERNQRAVLVDVEVYRPHHPCPGGTSDEEDS